MSIVVTPGKQYTFTFTSDGISVIDELTGTGSTVANGITGAGFPVSGLTWTAAGLSVDVNFTYNGAPTDSDSLGAAMANAINQNAYGNWNLSGAQAGIPIINPSTPGASVADKIKAALPSPGNTALIVAAVLIVAVGVYAFAGHAGSALGARV